MAAIIPIFISALPSLLSAGETVYGFIASMKTTLSQDAAWTSVQDEQWQQALKAAGVEPEWLS